MTRPPTTFDVISRNPSKCSSLTLSQNEQLLKKRMFDRLGKTSEKPHSWRGSSTTNPIPFLYVRGLKKITRPLAPSETCIKRTPY